MLFDNNPLVLIIDHMNFIPAIYETKFLIRVKTCHEEMFSMDNVFCTLLVVSSFPIPGSNEGSWILLSVSTLGNVCLIIGSLVSRSPAALMWVHIQIQAFIIPCWGAEVSTGLETEWGQQKHICLPIHRLLNWHYIAAIRNSNWPCTVAAITSDSLYSDSSFASCLAMHPAKYPYWDRPNMSRRFVI